MPLLTDEEIEGRLSFGVNVKTKVKSNFDSKAINQLLDDAKSGAYLTVGIPPEEPELAEIAIWNEYGTSTIPERSFFRSTLDRKAWDYDLKLNKMIDDVIRGKTTLYKGLMRFGRSVVKDIQNTIDRFTVPRNAPSTIARKGFDQPLIETGAMRDAITATVETEKP